MNKLLYVLIIITLAISIYSYLIATGRDIPKIVLDESITDAACYSFITTCASFGNCVTVVSYSAACKGGLGGESGDSPVRRR